VDIASRFATYFNTSVRHRGQQYAFGGAVRFDQHTADHVHGSVRGESQHYEFCITVVGRAIQVACTCPFFGSEGPCKHLWAVLLQAGKQGFLSLATAATKLVEVNIDEEDDDSEEDDEDDGDEPEDEAPFELTPTEPVIPALRGPSWRTQIGDVQSMALQSARLARTWPAKRQIVYIVDVNASIAAGAVTIAIMSRDLKQNGEWSRTVRIDLRRNEVDQLPNATDREILSALLGGLQIYNVAYGLHSPIPESNGLVPGLAARLIPLAAQSGRMFIRTDAIGNDLSPVSWDAGGEWDFGLEIRRGTYRWALHGVLLRNLSATEVPATEETARKEEKLDLANTALVTQGGFVFTRDRVAPLAPDVPFEWIAYLRRAGTIEVPDHDREEFLTALLNSARLPHLEVPEELKFEEVAVPLRPCLRISSSDKGIPRGGANRLRGDVLFDYGGRMVGDRAAGAGVYDANARRYIRRDSAGEKLANVQLAELGIRYQGSYLQEPAWEIPPAKLPKIVRSLIEKGWHVEADGKTFRRPGAFKVEVNSGLDWFELHGEVTYGDTTARLPELLEALRKGENMVRLSDGGYGMLPEEWLSRFGLIAGLGEAVDGHVRFRQSQAGLLDALLAAQPEAKFDEVFARVREELKSFAGIEAAPQPPGFEGQLRDYQREGVGWMEFLRRFSFGGCLADDMGVGKTAQVLAVLETRRAARAAGEELGPSLVVVPRSLVFNWKQEAARFTPKLSVLDYTGIGRTAVELNGFDLVITTYGTLRRDAGRLRDVAFDYVILDEAQAVKNASSESAKAVRLLNGRHRLAMSGTPVENHLGELWALFDFLNPGMLGAASVLKLSGGAARKPDEETRHLLAQALRPFILRRTKDQVARELPPRTEQTIYCELDAPQRKMYNELRQHYREGLLRRIETEGLKKSSFQVLEALLRLRQAACHPGLIDKKRVHEGSAKLETLLSQLREVLDEGHKALVFSQFTSFLDIVRKRLDGSGTVYEYLDGATRDRQERVERFQTDPNCKLFLVSLKAGGVGLNLTAAEYVFLLDPWWNPAVEAQAVDRAHRIGQMNQVFAYRLIARDTVEEKVLELQKSKRDLASAIIGADNSLIRNLKREDLELLLS
jgi:superfamily II DNA or RNA helicase